MELGLRVKPDEEMGKQIWDLALKDESFGILEKLKGLGFNPKEASCSYLTKFRLTKWLYENGYEINQPVRKDGSYPIHLACDSRNIQLIKFLMRKGADINCKDRKGYTPFHRFFKQKQFLGKKADLLFLQELVDLGADIETVNKKNATPLYTALKSRNSNLAIFLLTNQNADLNTPKITALGPIMLYVLKYLENCSNVSPAFETLLNRFPDVNVTDSKGRTCLHRVARSKYSKEFIKFFFRLGAKIDAQDLKGDTPMHILCRYPDRKWQNYKVQTLILLGANVHIRNNKGRKAV